MDSPTLQMAKIIVFQDQIHFVRDGVMIIAAQKLSLLKMVSLSSIMRVPLHLVSKQWTENSMEEDTLENGIVQEQWRNSNKYRCTY